jgi:hypothetical protein
MQHFIWHKGLYTQYKSNNLAWIPFQEDDHFGLERNLKRPIWTMPKALMAASHKVSPATKRTDPKSMLDRQTLNLKQVQGKGLRVKGMDIRSDKARILTVLFFISAMAIILFSRPMSQVAKILKIEALVFCICLDDD